MGGSGRKSLAQLAAFICGLTVMQIELRKGYDASCWRDDLKKLHATAGQGSSSGDNSSTGSKCIFLISDSQLSLPCMLDDLNTLLNTGCMLDLFNSEETSAICESVAASANAAKCGGSSAQVIALDMNKRRNCRIAPELYSSTPLHFLLS
jgi:dynein heavy chain